jgi:hypothetical protein
LVSVAINPVVCVPWVVSYAISTNVYACVPRTGGVATFRGQIWWADSLFLCPCTHHSIDQPLPMCLPRWIGRTPTIVSIVPMKVSGRSAALWRYSVESKMSTRSKFLY